MASRIEKRKLNTLAARRYRQKRLDLISSLEAELKNTQLERDALKCRVARLEGETEMLKELLSDRK
jgi:cell division protein FtsB